MARRTNLTLLAALLAAFVTGVLALWVGESRTWIVTWAHGAAGFAVLLLVRWKVPVVRRGLRRARPDMGAAVATAAWRWRCWPPASRTRWGCRCWGR